MQCNANTVRPLQSMIVWESVTITVRYIVMSGCNIQWNFLTRKMMEGRRMLTSFIVQGFINTAIVVTPLNWCKKHQANNLLIKYILTPSQLPTLLWVSKDFMAFELLLVQFAAKTFTYWAYFKTANIIGILTYSNICVDNTMCQDTCLLSRW